MYGGPLQPDRRLPRTTTSTCRRGQISRRRRRNGCSAATSSKFDELALVCARGEASDRSKNGTAVHSPGRRRQVAAWRARHLRQAAAGCSRRRRQRRPGRAQRDQQRRARAPVTGWQLAVHAATDATPGATMPSNRRAGGTTLVPLRGVRQDDASLPLRFGRRSDDARARDGTRSCHVAAP